MVHQAVPTQEVGWQLATVVELWCCCWCTSWADKGSTSWTSGASPFELCCRQAPCIGEGELGLWASVRMPVRMRTHLQMALQLP